HPRTLLRSVTLCFEAIRWQVLSQPFRIHGKLPTWNAISALGGQHAPRAWRPLLGPEVRRRATGRPEMNAKAGAPSACRSRSHEGERLALRGAIEFPWLLPPLRRSARG